MKKKFDAKLNYENTLKAVGYVPRRQATQATYDAIGFKSGLEVHQQLRTQEKLFCHCPSGIYQKGDTYDAELIRHMRPTLSELGEYDGTALMEFRTRKEIIYHIANDTACTYDVDDTPPFHINKEALHIAIEISLLARLNIVGEVHVTRKQYLDGSIPTGFQRTAIIGVEGEIPLRQKKVRLIQLSLEEDSCREISDIGHVRVYKTDRLGMPLIETVTYPDMVNPGEVMEACNYIRFLSRSTGKVRTGIGCGRQDVNVSCRGGTRVEIKGVAHTKWIPELTHNECFRQWALLKIREILQSRVPDPGKWKISHENISFHTYKLRYAPLIAAEKAGQPVIAVNLPEFRGILSHFTQPGKMFASEISDRLKVIACIEKPHMIHSEEPELLIQEEALKRIRLLLGAKENDAQLLIWGPEADMKTALEAIEERCVWAFNGVPNETRKSFPDGTTMFERVLPGADRMYPDTDTPPLPLEDADIAKIKKNLPDEVIQRYHQMKDWKIPEDTYTYIFKKNLYPIIEKIIGNLKMNPCFTGTFFGHTMKFVEGHHTCGKEFTYNQVYDLFAWLKKNKLQPVLARQMLPVIYEHPKMDFDSVLTVLKFKRIPEDEILSNIPFLREKFKSIMVSGKEDAGIHWIMGQIRKMAAGNMDLTKLSNYIVMQVPDNKAAHKK